MRHFMGNIRTIKIKLRPSSGWGGENLVRNIIKYQATASQHKKDKIGTTESGVHKKTNDVFLALFKNLLYLLIVEEVHAMV